MIATNVTLDIYSALVCLVLCGSLYAAKGKTARLRLYFLLMCAFDFGMAIGDIPSWVCGGFARTWYPVAQWAGSLAFWLCCTGMLLSFTAYLIE